MSDHADGADGAADRRVPPAETPTASGLLTLAVAVVVVAALYLARDILVPITLAVLLSFVLAPLVRLMRWMKTPRAPAAVAAILVALAVILAVGGVIGAQVATLAQDLPRYEYTIRIKVEAVRAATLGRITGLLERVEALRSGGASEAQPPATEPAPRRPAPGAAAAPARPPNAAAGASENGAKPTSSPLEVLQNVLSPVLSPIATLGIVLVIALFILLQQDDLRDRFIRLVGARDLHRTTVALNEAVRRLSRYFLTQLALNSAFGVVIAIGLYFIGLPSPVLWGIVAGLCRFIPYVGGFIAAALPAIVAAAVDPGWSMLLWTLGLFLVTEPLMGHVIEPVVYGHSTGLTPVSVVIAAIFWTWLWGPIGLILATPLTLCLVVVGRHVDRLEFLDVLLGDRPALSPVESFYQRMLAGDPDEVQDQAEALLRTRPLSAYYDEVALRALKLAAGDAARGALNMPHLLRLRDGVQELIEELDEYGDAEPQSKASEPPIAPAVSDAGESAAPPGEGLVNAQAGAPKRGALTVLCVAGATPLDEAAVAMLSQLLAKQGISAKRIASDRPSRATISMLDPAEAAIVCVSAIETSGNIGRLRLLVRRLRRRLPQASILIGLWPPDADQDNEAVRSEIGADRSVVSLTQTVRICLDARLSAAATAGQTPTQTDMADAPAAMAGEDEPPRRLGGALARTAARLVS